MVYEMMDADAMLSKDSRAREEANYASIEQRLAREDVSWSMAGRVGDIASCIAEQVGLADLIVLNRSFDDFIGPDMLGITSKLVLKVRKPIVAVPEDLRRFNVATTAVVAWDGSQAAMAALTAAVPLLRLAGAVAIVEVVRSSGSSAQDAAAYLSRHDIHPELELISSDVTSTARIVDLIQSACRDKRAGYCVMGAYGHSRVLETMFGGVTRSMLKTSSVPLLIAH
jgi:nucleotide-binding universal stress UspA family protein